MENYPRPLPEPLQGELIDLSGGRISWPDFILGLCIGAMVMFLFILVIYVLELKCRC